MGKLKINPIFIVICAFFIFSGKFSVLSATIFCVIIHEGAHYLVAKSLGYALTRLNLMPYGAVLSGDADIPDKDMFYIAAAGPLSNFILAILIVAFWWIFPSTYSFTLHFFRANLAIGVFNMLPIHPLDGGRIALSFAKNKLRCLKVLKIIGIIFGCIFAALFVVTAFFTINYTFAVLSLTLVSGAVSNFEKEKYIMLSQQIYFITDFSHPIEKKELFVNSEMKISALLREIRRGYYYTLHIIDNKMTVLKTLQGAEIETLFYADRNARVSNLII